MKVSNNNANINRVENGRRSPSNSKKLFFDYKSVVAANSTFAADDKENSFESNVVAATIDEASANKTIKPLKVKVPVKLVIKQPLANALISSNNPFNQVEETIKSISISSSSSNNSISCNNSNGNSSNANGKNCTKNECVVKISSICNSSSSSSNNGGSVNSNINILSKPLDNQENISSSMSNDADLPHRNHFEITNQHEITLKLKKKIREQDGTICKLNSQLGKHSNSLHQSQEQLTRAMSILKTREEEISSLKSSVRFAEGSVTLMRYRMNKNNSNDSGSIKTNDTNNCNINSDTGSNISRDSNDHTKCTNASHEANVKSKIYLNGAASRESIDADKHMEYDFLLSQVHFYWIHHFRKFSSALRCIKGHDMGSSNYDDENNNDNVSSQHIEFTLSNPAAGSNDQYDIKSDNKDNDKNNINNTSTNSTSSDKANILHEVFASPLAQRYAPKLNTATLPAGSEEKNSNMLSPPSLSNLEVLMLPNIEKHSPTLLKKLITAWPSSSQPVRGPQWPPLHSPSSEIAATTTMALSASAIISSRQIATSLQRVVSPSPSIFDRMLQIPCNEDRCITTSSNQHQRLDNMNESFELNVDGVTYTTVANANAVTNVSSKLAASPNSFKVQISRLKHENEQAKLEINRFKDMLNKYKSF